MFFFVRVLSKFYMWCGNAKLYTLRSNITEVTVNAYYNVNVRQTYYNVAICYDIALLMNRTQTFRT